MSGEKLPERPIKNPTMSSEKLPEPPIKNPKVPMPIDISESNPMATAERHVGRAYQKFFTNIWYKYLHNAEFGLYPKEYNKRVHGHYLPWRNYGKGSFNQYLVLQNFFRLAFSLKIYFILNYSRYSVERC